MAKEPCDREIQTAYARWLSDHVDVDKVRKKGILRTVRAAFFEAYHQAFLVGVIAERNRSNGAPPQSPECVRYDDFVKATKGAYRA